MSFEEMVVALVGAIGGIALVGFIFAKITGLIKAWINRNNSEYSEEDFNRLARAFMQHKKDTERRLQNLEAIAGGDELSDPEAKSRQIEERQQSIEIDDKEQEKTDSGNKNLRNMLRE